MDWNILPDSQSSPQGLKGVM